MLLTVLVFYTKTKKSTDSKAKIAPESVDKLSFSSKKKIKLKSVCCEKYKKNKRCKRCPCYDISQPFDLI